MIRYANEELKAGVVNMWKTCFGDSDEFMELYFRNKYRHEHTLVEVVNGKLVSSLQILPYRLTFGNEIIPVAYISGAATFPEERKKGYMDALLRASFQEMKKENIPLSILIPQEEWLFGFYEKSGYAPVFDMQKRMISLPEEGREEISVKEASLKDVPLVARFCNAMLERKPMAVQKKEEDWKTVFEDYFLVNGKILCAWSGNKITGVCFSFIHENVEVILKGILAESETIENALLYKVRILYGKDTAIRLDPGTGMPENTFPFGMARIIDGPCLLSLFAAQHPELCFTIRIYDKQLEWNEGCFEIKNGICQPFPEKEKSIDFEIPVTLLARLLSGYRINELPPEYAIFPEYNPYMTLMLE